MNSAMKLVHFDTVTIFKIDHVYCKQQTALRPLFILLVMAVCQQTCTFVRCKSAVCANDTTSFQIVTYMYDL